MTLSQIELGLIAAWAARKAKPSRGVYFRSVSYTFMNPETVLNGAGTAARGGRFASPGPAAVYLSESDAVATSEVTGRKKRLGGAALITVDRYPRVVFAVGFDLTCVLDLTQHPLPRAMVDIRNKCLGDDLAPSQRLGDVIVSQGIEGLMFPSLSVAVKNGAILAGPAWRPGRFAFGLFLAGVALVSQVAGAPTCQPGDVSAPTTSARVVLVVLPKWPLRALPPTSKPSIRNAGP